MENIWIRGFIRAYNLQIFIKKLLDYLLIMIIIVIIIKFIIVYKFTILLQMIQDLEAEYVKILQKIQQKIQQDDSFEQLVFYLNQQIVNVDNTIKKHLEYPLMNFLKIKRAQNMFKIQIGQLDEQSKKIHILNYKTYVLFQKVMNKQQIKKDYRQFEIQISDLISNNHKCVFWLTFQRKSILELLIEYHPQKLISFLREQQINLAMEMEDHQKCYFNLLKNMQPRAKEQKIKNIAQQLLKLLKQNKIQFQQKNKEGENCIQVFSKFIDKQILKKYKINIDESNLFATMRIKSTKFQKCLPRQLPSKLSLDNKIEIQLQKLLFDDSIYNQIIFSNQDIQLKVSCQNNKFSAIIRQKQYINEVDLRYVGWPINQKVIWSIIQENKDPIYLTEEESENLQNNKESIFIKQINCKIMIDQDTLKVSKITDIEQKNIDQSKLISAFGYLRWVPNYKITKQQQNDQVDISNPQFQAEKMFQQKKINLNNSIGEVKFPYLGLFQEQFTVDPEDFQVIKQTNEIRCSKNQVIQYFNDFKARKMIEIYEQNLSKDITGQKLILEYQDKYCKKLEQKLIFYNKLLKNKTIFTRSNNKIEIKNIFQINHKFPKKFFEYLYNIIKMQNLNHSIYIQNIKPKDEEIIKSVLKQNSNVSIIKQNQKSKIIAPPTIIKQIVEVMIQKKVNQILNEGQVYNQLKIEMPQFVKNIDLKIEQIDQERIHVEGQISQYLKFYQKLTQFKQELRQRELNQKLKLSLKYNIKYLSKYREGFKEFKDVQLGMQKQKLIVYYRKYQQNNIKQAIQKIENSIQADQIEQIKRSETQLIINNIQTGIAIYILNRIQQEISRIKQDKIQSKIKLQRLDLQNKQGTSFKYKLVNMRKQTGQIFIKLMKSIQKRLKQYLNEIKLAQKILQKEHRKRLSILQYSNKSTLQQRKYIKNIRKSYQQNLKSIVSQLIKQFRQKILVELENFIKNQDINNLQFKSNQINIINQFNNKLLNIKVFQSNFEDLLKELNHLKLKKPFQKIKKYYKYIDDQIRPKMCQFDLNLAQQKFDLGIITDTIFKFKILKNTFFNLDLPIIDHLEEFERIFKNNQIIIIKTGTGSGKSSVIPPFIAGLGYKKILVTQPRRIACQKIYERVKDTYGDDLVGYNIAGESKNQTNPLIYATDGLAKQIFYHDQSNLDKVDVLMIDEIHQRTKNIDLLLLLIAKNLEKNRKTKILLCSATIDDSIIKMFGKIKSETFFVEVNRFPVTKIAIEGVSILDKVNQLSGKLNNTEQLLVFFPGIAEVNQATALFNQSKQKKAYALHGAQKYSIQQKAIQEGQIFFATAVAQTSLTFPNLKYVIDSRRSRIMKYSLALQLMISEQLPASQSSVKQRQGRVGRNCPGQYYYYQYNAKDKQNQDRFDSTQLERIDLTNVIFELILKYKSFDTACNELKKLNLRNPNNQLQQKIQYSKNILKKFEVLIDKKTSSISPLYQYGNLGNVRANYALAKANQKRCLGNMIAIIAFNMIGSNILDKVLEHIPNPSRYQNSDIISVSKYIIHLKNQIDLENLKTDMIQSQLSKYDNLKNKDFFKIFVRVFIQMKKMLLKKPNALYVQDPDIINQVLIKSYSTSIYFNRYLIGGNKIYYEKLDTKKTYQEDNKTQEALYQINRSSYLFDQKNQNEYKCILALNSIVNPYDQCTLNYCSLINPEQIDIEMKMQLYKRNIDLQGLSLVKQNQIYNSMDTKRKNYGLQNTHNNQNQLQFKGKFPKMLNYIDELEKLRRNILIIINLKERLEANIQRRKYKINNPDNVRANFQQLDLRSLFLSIIFQFENKYNVNIKFNRKKQITISNAKNWMIKLFMQKIQGFFTWFIFCQTICTEDLKLPPTQPNSKQLTQKIYLPLLARINQIVDSKIEYHIIKNLAFGKNKNRYPRTCRMIAVAWVLVTKFDCTIKGGFVRDWVVNGRQYLPAGDLSKLLQLNPNNRYLQVIDNKVTPSDLDVQLPQKFFSEQLFIREMKKLGILVKIQYEGWRRHVLFDQKSPTGGFTADLIEPFCYISHDNYDFDVNIFYLKKDHLNLIGMKIPLTLIQTHNALGEFRSGRQTQISLSNLILSCQRLQMRKIKPDIPLHRINKFTERGWTIKPQLYEPVVYKNYKTSSHIIEPPLDIKTINKTFYDEMVVKRGFKVKKIEALKNYSWDTGYNNALAWIQKQVKNVNQKILYHGTSTEGAKGIKQNGFDARYYSKSGMYGRGAYFADIPSKSHDYTNQNGQRHMFIVRVALGNQQHLTTAQNDKLGPSKGYHSILGTAGQVNQYIIERWDQAKPIYLITYQ